MSIADGIPCPDPHIRLSQGPETRMCPFTLPLFESGILAHLDCIDEEDLQQREVQVVEHIQDITLYRHLDNIWVKEGWRDLGGMEKLLEQRRQSETEPYIELLFTKVGSIMRQILSGHRLVIY